MSYPYFRFCLLVWKILKGLLMYGVVMAVAEGNSTGARKSKISNKRTFSIPYYEYQPEMLFLPSYRH